MYLASVNGAEALRLLRSGALIVDIRDGAEHDGGTGGGHQPAGPGAGDHGDGRAVRHAERATDVLGDPRIVHAAHATHLLGQYPGRDGSTSRVHASIPPANDRTPVNPAPDRVVAARAERTPDLQ